jgi:hypothetical protein
MIPLGLNDWSSILKTHQNHILEETTKKKGKYFGRRINGEFQLKFQRWMNIHSFCTCLKTEDLCTKGKST